MVHLYLGQIDFEPTEDNMPPTKDVKKIMDPAMEPLQIQLGLHLLQRGIATFCRGLFVLSAAHSKEHIDQTVQAFGDSLNAMIVEGTIGQDLRVR